MSNILDMYALNDDTTPSFSIDQNGGVAIGYSNALGYRLRIGGNCYFGGSVAGVSTLSMTGTLTTTLSSSSYATSLSPTVGVNAT
jgi:hypothetical protein